MSSDFSRRTAMSRASNGLAEAKAAYLDGGDTLLDLTVSNPTSVDLPYPFPEITAALAKASSHPYAPAPLGLRTARQAVGAHLGVDAERVVLAASTSELYGWLFKLLCDPGDQILAPVPSYPLFHQLAAFEGVELGGYPLVYDGRWHIDFPALRAAITPRTRAILVVNPNNPTGHGLDRQTAAKLAELGLPIISDEVFADYSLEGRADAVSASTITDVPVFVLGGLSKTCGMPQMKLGWAVLGGPPKEVIEARERLELVADTWLSLTSAVQHALPTLLVLGARVRKAIRTRLATNLEHLRRATEGTALDALTVEAGWYAVLAVPRVCSDEEWVHRLLGDGVWVQPGWFYDFPRPGHLVVSLLTPELVFADGVARLVARINAA